LNRFTLKHEIYLVNVAVMGMKFMVLSDVLADESQGTNHHLDADFLQTFPSKRFGKCLSRFLPPARQTIPIAIGVSILDRK